MTTSTLAPPGARPRRRGARLLHGGLVVVLALAVGVLVLLRLDTPVSTPVGVRGVGAGSFPVVEVVGLGSDGGGFAALTSALEEAGTTVLDFDPRAPGTQPLTYQPAVGETIEHLATATVQPAIRAALGRAGLDPRTQVVDVVAHSMGGLLMRYLIEHPVEQWAAQVDDLVMVATPNHGSDVVSWETRRDGSPFAVVGSEMDPDSAFLRDLGFAEPTGEVYTTIGGDPWFLRWYRHGSHGFDDQVPTESPLLTGAATDTFGYTHGSLLPAAPVVDLVVRTLAAR